MEKRRFSVFALYLENKFTIFVQICPQEAFAMGLGITCSDSEYGLLFVIQISDSYLLNVFCKQHLESQNVVWIGYGGMIW